VGAIISFRETQSILISSASVGFSRWTVLHRFSITTTTMMMMMMMIIIIIIISSIVINSSLTAHRK
jgi:hypothetical protein